MAHTFSQTAAYIWSLADILRGDFKQSQYGHVILPFTILRRLECVLELRKSKVLAQVETLRAMTALQEDAREIFEHFRFDEFVAALDEANLLYKVVQKVATPTSAPRPSAITTWDLSSRT